MNKTNATIAPLFSLSDLESHLFGHPASLAANSAAYELDYATVPVASAAANERPYLPDPPEAPRSFGVVEPVLLRVA